VDKVVADDFDDDLETIETDESVLPSAPPRRAPGICSVLQCVAVCCSVLQCVAVCCSVCNVLQCVVEVCCSVLLQCVAVCCSVLLQCDDRN